MSDYRVLMEAEPPAAHKAIAERAVERLERRWWSGEGAMDYDAMQRLQRCIRAEVEDA